jgi:hypothetical protein
MNFMVVQIYVGYPSRGLLARRDFVSLRAIGFQKLDARPDKLLGCIPQLFQFALDPSQFVFEARNFFGTAARVGADAGHVVGAKGVTSWVARPGRRHLLHEEFSN